MRRRFEDSLWFYLLIGIIGTAIIWFVLLIPWPAQAAGTHTPREYAEECLDGVEISDPAISRDMLKAICWYESNWRQFENGRPYRTSNPGSKYASWGIAQIYDDPACRYPGIDYQLVKINLKENLKAGVSILHDKFLQARRIRKLYRISNKHSDAEIGLRLYNGWRPRTGGKWDYAKAVMDIMADRPWEGRKLK